MSVQEFNLSDIKSFVRYRYMFKQIGIEFWFFNKKRSMLIIFDDSIT